MNWKKYVYFVVAGAVLLSGLVTVIYFGIQPRSVPKINLSHFDQPEQAGAAVVKRLWMEFKNAPVLLVGVWPEHGEEIKAVEGLRTALAAEPGAGYDTMLVENGLLAADIFPEAQRVSFGNDVPGIAAGLRKAREQNLRVMILVPSMFSSQLITDGPAQRLRKEMGDVNVMSISVSPFPLRREDEAKTGVRCDTGDGRTGADALGCAVMQKSRVLYRKKKEAGKFAAAVDLFGATDYIFLLAPVPAAP